MKNHFEWKGQGKVGSPRRARDGGYIAIDTDKDGLPILRIEVDDDYYSGEIDHKTLFRLITELAETGIEKRIQDNAKE